MDALIQIRKSRTLICLTSLLLLAACANRQAVDEEVAATPPAADRTAETRAVAESGELSRQEASRPSQLVIHFDFDDSSVGPSYRDLLVAHGRYLADHGGVSLRLEGHADERGTREYNIGLGERRASAVRQLLLLQGAHDGQIEILSYGEERPVIAKSDERSWAENRRVEFNYLSR